MQCVNVGWPPSCVGCILKTPVLRTACVKGHRNMRGLAHAQQNVAWDSMPYVGHLFLPL